MAKIQTSKEEALGAVETAYQVNAPGYSETFETKAAALKQAEILKKRAIKSTEPINVSVKEMEVGGKGREVHKIKIGEEFYK